MVAQTRHEAHVRYSPRSGRLVGLPWAIHPGASAGDLGGIGGGDSRRSRAAPCRYAFSRQILARYNTTTLSFLLARQGREPSPTATATASRASPWRGRQCQVRAGRTALLAAVVVGGTIRRTLGGGESPVRSAHDRRAPLLSVLVDSEPPPTSMAERRADRPGHVRYARSAGITKGDSVSPCSGVIALSNVHIPSNRSRTRNDRSRWSQRGASLMSMATSAASRARRS